MLSKVDLPQPDGPIMATNSPSSTVKDTLFKAIVSTSSVRNDLQRFSTFIILFNVKCKMLNVKLGHTPLNLCHL